MLPAPLFQTLRGSDKLNGTEVFCLGAADGSLPPFWCSLPHSLAYAGNSGTKISSEEMAATSREASALHENPQVLMKMSIPNPCQQSEAPLNCKNAFYLLQLQNYVSAILTLLAINSSLPTEDSVVLSVLNKTDTVQSISICTVVQFLLFWRCIPAHWFRN